jgi:hypothetical protein
VRAENTEVWCERLRERSRGVQGKELERENMSVMILKY